MSEQPKWPWEQSPNESFQDEPLPLRPPPPPTPVSPFLEYGKPRRTERSVGESILRLILIAACILFGIFLLLVGACFAVMAGMGHH